jgi:hypothetical protein
LVCNIPYLKKIVEHKDTSDHHNHDDDHQNKRPRLSQSDSAEDEPIQMGPDLLLNSETRAVPLVIQVTPTPGHQTTFSAPNSVVPTTSSTVPVTSGFIHPGAGFQEGLVAISASFSRNSESWKTVII